MIPVIEQILLVIVEQIGLPALLQWILARTPQEEAQAILVAQFAAAKAAVDAQAKAELGG